MMVRRQLPRFTYSFAALLHVVTFCWVCYSEAEAWAPPSAGSAQDSLGSLPKEDSRPSSLQGEESRKGFLLKGLSSSFVVLLTSTDKAAAAETVGKDPDCDDITCLGVWDGLLAGEQKRKRQVVSNTIYRRSIHFTLYKYPESKAVRCALTVKQLLHVFLL